MLPAPSNPTATGGVGSIALSWSAVTGATSYDVLRSTTSGGPYVSIGTTPGTTSEVSPNSSEVAATVSAPSGAPLENFPIIAGGILPSVSATALSGSTLYIGGSFTYVGPHTGTFAALDDSTGTPASLPAPDSTVNATVPDGSGGWYIGGNFNHVGSISRSGLAHITAAGELDAAFNPSMDGVVYSLALSGDGSTLYVGGDFQHLGGQVRNDLGAVSTANGAATAFNPDVTGNGVTALALDGSALYAGGLFTAVGGVSRPNLAKIDVTTSVVDTTFNANVNAATDYVNALALSGSTLYVGGHFDNIGGATHHNVAALQTASGAAVTAFADPGTNFANGDVNALALSGNGSTLYAGGNFNAIGGLTRTRLAALQTANGLADSSFADPDVNNAVTAIALSGDGQTLYAGGFFTSIGGEARSFIGAVSTVNGAVTSFDPSAENTVRALAFSGSTLAAGGNFVSAGGAKRQNLAAIDASTNQVTSFDPSPTSSVNALAVSGNNVYAGGFFTSIGGQTRTDLAKLDGATGAADPLFDASADGGVKALGLSSDGLTLYTGGSFSNIGGAAHHRIAKLNAADGTEVAGFADDTTFTAAETVNALALSGDGNTLYAGGAFLDGGQGHDNLVALNTSDGTATTFAPNPDFAVNALALKSGDSMLYVGGGFNHIGSQALQPTIHNLAVVNTATGVADDTSFVPDPNNPINALALTSDDSLLYAGGGFTSIGGSTRRGIGAVSTTDGTANSFDANAQGGGVTALTLSGDDSTLYAGGNFTTIRGLSRTGLAAFPPVPSTTINSNPPSTQAAGGDSTFTFSSSDPSATFECQLDGSAFEACVSPKTYHDLSSGGHQFVVRAIANGQTDPSPPSYSWNILAHDGSGTLIASPTAVSASSQHKTITFTYTVATGGIAGGLIFVDVPAGWSPPSTGTTSPGYVTSSAGTASVVDVDTFAVANLTLAAGATVTLTYGSRAGGGPGATASSTTGVQTWTAKEQSSSGGTPTALSLSPKIQVYAADGSGTLTRSPTAVSASSQHQTIKFTYAAATGGILGGAVTLTVPSGWSAPSTLGSQAGFTTASAGSVSVASRTITVSGLTLVGGAKVTITYGSRAASGPGATAPGTTGVQTWAAKEKSLDGDALKSLASSPQIKVCAPDGSGKLTTPTTSVAHGSTGKTITFTYTTASGGIQNGQVTLTVPSGWSAPSTSGSARGFVKSSLGTVSISSRTIVVSGLTRLGTQTFTITYGSKASGGPGATAPGTAVGQQTWLTKEKSTPTGVLTALASSPKITVT